MVTQAPSGRIRTQIGIAKRRVEDCLEEDVVARQEVEGYGVDDVQQFLEDVHEDLDRLFKRCEKLADLDRKWNELMAMDGNEKQVQENYISEHGSYLEVLERGKIRMQVMKELYNIGINRLKTLDENRLILVPTLEEIGKEENSTDAGRNDERKEVRSKITAAEMQKAEQRVVHNGSVQSRTDDNLVSVQTVAPSAPQPILVNTFGHITLPQMTLPTFSGDVTAYYEFKESFESIMNSIKVDELTKLHYLKSIVSGEAGELIKYLQTTHSNYAIAMTMLEEQYGGKERIQHVLLQQLREIPDVTSSNTDAAALQSFITKATSIFSQLIGFGLEMDNVSTADIIKCKLPKRVIAKIYGVTNDEIPKSAKELLKRVREISRAESLVAAIYNYKKEKPVTTMAAMNNHQHNRNQHQHRSEQRGGHGKGMQQQSDSRSKVNKPCSFCVEERMKHRPSDCRKFDTVELRKQRAKELKLCFRCLQSGHTARQCSFKCYCCNGLHHEAFCYQREERSSGNSTSTGPSIQPSNNQISGAKGCHPFSNQSGGQNNASSGGYQGYQRKQKPRSYQSHHQGQGNGQQQQTFALEATEKAEESHTHLSQSDAEEDVQTTATADAVSHSLEIGAEEKDEVIEVIEATPKPPVIMMSTDVPIIDDNGEEHMATVFFDSGSNTSYIRKEFADRLNLKPTGKKKLNVSTFAHRETKRMVTSTFDVCIKTRHATATVQLCSVDNIASNIVTVDVESDMLQRLLKDQYVKLKRTRKEVDILIGLDSYLEILGQVNTVRLSNGLHLYITDVGPIVAGQEHVVEDSAITYTTTTDGNMEDGDLHLLLKSFWNLESIGIIDVNPKSTINEETQAFFDSTTYQTSDGRYVVRLPYASKEKIPSNRQLAFFRLQGALKKLMKTEKLFDQYSNTFKEQISLDFIELVSNEQHLDGEVLHYLAHHPVFKESSKSTKMRIVFDGSAKLRKNDLSLNEHLMVGTNFLPDIAACLLRMRKFVILISADIQKAFLQLELNIQDRDATRFLWVDDDGKVICYRFKRVPFGLKSSPYLLNATIRLHLSKQPNPVAKEMARSIYVDNVYVGVQSVAEAQQFYHVSKEIFGQAKMNLTQYCSNSDEANEYFAGQEKAEKESGIQKLLGVKWDTSTDEFIFCFPVPKADIVTKRKALKFIATVYDPTGFLSPTTLFGKLFFKLLTEAKMSWDEMLSKDFEEKWKVVLKNWSGEEWRVTRRLIPDQFLSTSFKSELHVFTDASQLAYGAVAYIRFISHLEAQSFFLMAKSRVAPSTPSYTIPQLEMLAVLTGVRLAVYIHREMDYHFDGTFLWTDSMCSLDTLKARGTAGSKFVRNRVQQIQQQLEHISEDVQFSHIPGKLNPADLLTRGLAFEELKQSEKWIHGAEFLREIKELPIRQSSVEEVAVTTCVAQEDYVSPIDPYRFESFHRMLRTVMLVLHFINRGKISIQQQVRRARIVLYRVAQWSDPPSKETIESLRLRKNEDGIWIYRGRVQQKNLVFLPSGRIARMLVLEQHRIYNHASPLFTLAQLREVVWIPRGRSFVQKVIKGCLGCRRFNVKPYQQPVFSPFPDSRVLLHKPFENCGVDFAGPLYVQIGQVKEEIYFVLYTCLFSRYIVTDVVRNMETTTFLLSLRKFCAMFGIPKQMISDNGTQFTMLSKVLGTLKLQQSSGIITSTTLPEFKLIPAHSPWAGGVYERMIGLVKRILVRAGATKTLMQKDDFITLLAECTALVNCRPLSYVASEDDITPIRPIDLIFPLNRFSGIMDISSPPDTDNQTKERKNLMVTWSQLSSLTEAFHRRFNKEYVQLLQERRDFEHQQRSTSGTTPKVGDIVLIEFPSLGRTRWPMGRIIEVKSRSAIVKNGSTKKVVEYPWKSLYPLETELDEDKATPSENTSQKKKNDGQSTATSAGKLRRSTRLKAVTSLSMIVILFSLCSSTTAAITTRSGTTSAANTTRLGTTPAAANFTRLETTSAVNTTRLETTSAAITIRLGTTPMAATEENATTIATTGSWNSTMITTTGSTNNMQPVQHLYWKYGNISDNLLELMILFGVLYILSVLMAMLKTLMVLILVIVGVIKRIFIGCWFLLSWCFNISRIGQKYQKIAVVVFMMVMEQVLACNEIASIQANDTLCRINSDNKTVCMLSTVSILNIRPNGSIGCFRVQNKDQLDAFVEIQANAIVSTCIQKTHHFARDFDIELDYIHRCWRAGSCYDDVCEKLSPTDTSLPELSSTSKNSPGYTRCQKTCGCITCGGCFYCSPSCLFTRIYAIPKSKDVYEVISCPAWETKIDVTVNYNGRHVRLRVPHGVPYTINNTNISLTVTGFSTPPTPLHAATFLKKWKSDGTKRYGFTYTSIARAGAPSRGLIGEFMCATMQNANDFKCVFDENLCKCFVQGTSMSCACNSIKLKDIVEKESIPAREAGIEVAIEKEKIITRLTTQSLVSIQLQFRNQTIQRIVKEDQCIISGITLEGCFSCGGGAKLMFKCQSSSNDKIQATVSCPSFGIEFVECGREGVSGYINIHSSKRKVEESCQIECGSKPTTFSVNAELEERILFESKDVEGKFAEFSEKVIEGTFFESIKDIISSGWNSLLLFIGKYTLILVLMVVAVCLVMFNCSAGSYGLLSIFWRECRTRDRVVRYQRRKRR